MKKLLILITLLLIQFSFSQVKLSPYIGGRYTGGLSYDLDNEFFSGEVGINLEHNENYGILTGYQLIYDSAKVYTKTTSNLYAIRLQPYKYINNQFAFTIGASYMDSYDNSFTHKKLGYNVGVLLIDDVVIGGLVYENLANYGHVSIQILVKIL